MHYQGLSNEEVIKRQKEYGKNIYNKPKRTNIFWLFIQEFNDWLVIILIIAAILSLIIDRGNLIESTIIMGILVINASIGVFQEVKAFKTLESLEKYNQHEVLVLRNNQQIKIEAKDLTIGDLVYLHKGEEIAADMRLIEVYGLSCDESILTGESVEITKNKGDMVYASTFITNGNAFAEVIKVGMKTEMGKIAASLIEEERKPTPLEIKLNQIGKAIGIIAVIICIGVFGIELALKIEPLEAFKSAISLAVAAIPEGLATVVTICLAIGVSKMAKENVIIKRLEAVETLGCSNVVCSDKTGTLTRNEQKLISYYGNAKYQKYLAIIANHLQEKVVVDPIDKEISNHYPNNYDYSVESFHPFDSERKYMDLIIKENQQTYHLYKGAFDVLIKDVNLICEKSFIAEAKQYMQKGYRVIGLGINYEIKAIIAFFDPPRENIQETIEMAKNAHVKTVMITGDHKDTAFAIAKEIGITNDINEVITGDELKELTDEELRAKVEKIMVYARVKPIDKVRIVNSFQKNGKIVAMTGDGVNDAPALKKADIGASMGSGCDVAKEASDMIILDNNYQTIISAVKNGRGIYANIVKCTKYLLASNIGEVLTIVIVTLLSLITGINYGIPLASLQLLWINIITDSLPAFGLGVIKAENEVMYEPPRQKNDNFFSGGIAQEIIFFGLCVGLLTLISYFIGLNYFPTKASTMAFVTISSTQLFHAFNCHSKRSIFHKKIFKNHLLLISFIVGMALMLLVIYSNGINEVFSLVKLSVLEFMIAFLLASTIIFIAEIYKKIIKITK